MDYDISYIKTSTRFEFSPIALDLFIKNRNKILTFTLTFTSVFIYFRSTIEKLMGQLSKRKLGILAEKF